ncbi:hypothetical protein M408DRAFT_30886 [Serendipita vermifera MAFF 305830]|uniref:Uncharacterized protein n=1 Tax=Serendipita vermifera MAFF 305830 TaxID=933852 RepID=A0A0C3A573_SERVB|nr:hypothetical protein M408DRAFT_30886 [Serendipita vermifera MAFF 305830]
MIIVDDVSDKLVYSNSGPSWWGATGFNGQGRYVGGHIANSNDMPYDFTWHETIGDGAFVSLTFTGTRVNLTGSVCARYPTIVDFYIDEQYMSRFEHQPATLSNNCFSSVDVLYPMANFDDLAPAQHTFRAVSVGAGTLFAIDFLAYEPSDAIPVSNTSTSLTNSVVSTGSTTSGASTTSSMTLSTTSSSSSTSSRSTLSPPTISTPAGDSQPVAAAMDVPASDSRIIYSPPGAWDAYNDTQRAVSCLEGTMSSSTAGSSLTYNFTGSSIQVYTVSSTVGASYSINIDGQDQGTYSSSTPSADLPLCSSRALYSNTGLIDIQHMLVLTVLDVTANSTQDTVQFVGFRISSTSSIQSSDSPPTSGPNIGAIIGGVVGSLTGLVLVIFLVTLWMWHQRQTKEDSLAGGIDVSVSPSHRDDPFTSVTRSEDHSQTRAQWVAESMRSAGPPLTLRPSRPSLSTSHQALDDASVDHLTYYTLPSYHENAGQNTVARDLSEADIEAISRRLREVMRGQVSQSGRAMDGLGNTIPPR